MTTTAWWRRATVGVAAGMLVAGCGGSMGDRKMSGEKMSGEKMSGEKMMSGDTMSGGKMSGDTMTTGDKASDGGTTMKDDTMTKDGMSMERK